MGVRGICIACGRELLPSASLTPPSEREAFGISYGSERIKAPSLRELSNEVRLRE